jgi:hypothetical protein
LETWARVRRWMAKAKAQARVRRSPVLMAEKISRGAVPAGVVRRSRPVKARIAPPAAARPGRCVPAGRKNGISVRAGTKTTTRPVTKADLAGVVRARPRVCS